MNKVILIGYAVSDPTQKNGVCNFRLVTKKPGYTKSDGTTVPEKEEFHSISVFDSKTSDFVSKYVKTKSCLQVEGEIHYSKWTDAAGIERNGVNIVAQNISFFSLK